MKKKLNFVLILFITLSLKAQNHQSSSIINYKDVDSSEVCYSRDSSIFLNKVYINNGILERYMNLSINAATIKGCFDDDGSGLFFVFAFYGEYREHDYFYSHIIAYNNSFMSFFLQDNIEERNCLSSTDSIRLIGYLEYQGYLFLLLADDYVKNEDLYNIINISPEIGVIQIKDYCSNSIKKDMNRPNMINDSTTFIKTEELLIPYIK